MACLGGFWEESVLVVVVGERVATKNATLRKFRLGEEEWALWKAVAAREGVPLSVLIKRAVRAEVELLEAEWREAEGLIRERELLRKAAGGG